MVTFVFDATPLIHLAKIKILDKISAQMYIPSLVYNETVNKGKEIGKEDALYIEKLIDTKKFIVMKSKKELKISEGILLSTADQEAIQLTKELNGLLVMDETVGRKVAELNGVQTTGSIGILFYLLKKKKLTKQLVRDTINQMIDNGWYCSTQFYARIVGQL